MYSVGNGLKVSLFGKSHADCIGCIVEGLPIGTRIDIAHIEEQMALRKPSDGIGTPRKESDSVVFEHGVKDGVVTDDNILMTIYNGNRDSSAYDRFKIRPRPGHSDLPASFKYKDYDVDNSVLVDGLEASDALPSVAIPPLPFSPVRFSGETEKVVIFLFVVRLLNISTLRRVF